MADEEQNMGPEVYPVVSYEGSGNLGDLTELLTDDLATFSRDRSLFWKQDKSMPWWQKLGYQSEEEARSDLRIEKEGHIRDFVRLSAETEHFDVFFLQGPLYGRTMPQGFHEALEFVLKKEVWKGKLAEGVPSAYMFFPKGQLTQEQVDYFSSPRFGLERHVNWKSANADLKAERMFDWAYDELGHPKDRIHEVPGAEKLVRTIVLFSENDDVIFTGRGEINQQVRRNLGGFKRNLQAAYGIATAQCGSGIHVSPYIYGT